MNCNQRKKAGRERKKVRCHSSSVSERKQSSVFCFFLFAQQSLHAAIIRTGWPWLEPNASALLSFLAVSPSPLSASAEQSKTRGGGGFQHSLMSLLALVWVCVFHRSKYSTELQVVHGNVNWKAVILLAWGDDSIYEIRTQTHHWRRTESASVTAGGGGYVIRHQVNSISAVR